MFVKSKKITIIIFCLAGLLIVIGIVLIIFPGNLLEREDGQNNDTNSTNSESLMYNEEYMNLHTTVENTLGLVDNNLINYYPIENFQNMSSEKKTEFLIKVLSNGQSISKTALEEEKSKYFSSDAKLIYKNFDVDDYTFNYNEETGQYTKRAQQYKNYFIESKVVDEQLTDNSWVVEKAVYFLKSTSLPDLFPQKVYTTVEDAKKDKNSIYTINNADELLSIEENYNKIKDKLTVYKYTLKKDNDIYKIQSIEKE